MGPLADEKELTITGSIIPGLREGHPDIGTVFVVSCIVGFARNPEPNQGRKQRHFMPLAGCLPSRQEDLHQSHGTAFIPALMRMRQEDQKFKVNLGSIASP